jgi:hypothetical protein
LLFRNSALEIIPERMFLKLVPDIGSSKQTFLPACFQETAIVKRDFELQEVSSPGEFHP